MTQQEYENHKRECWEEFMTRPHENPQSLKRCFDFAFDRAFALGKQTETISQEEIEKAALDYIRTNPFVNFRTATTARESFVDGANFTLGKQEKDAEDTVISGWAARSNDGPNDLGLRVYTVKPDRRKNRNGWNGHGEMSYLIDCRLFPDLTWESDPLPVEIIIKRKKHE